MRMISPTSPGGKPQENPQSDRISSESPNREVRHLSASTDETESLLSEAENQTLEADNPSDAGWTWKKTFAVAMIVLVVGATVVVPAIALIGSYAVSPSMHSEGEKYNHSLQNGSDALTVSYMNCNGASCESVPMSHAWSPPMDLDDRHLVEYRGLAKRTGHRVMAVARDLTASSYQLPYRMGFLDKDYFLDTSLNNPTFSENSESLYLMVHGLNGHPSIWVDYADAVLETDPGADVVVPYVPTKGNCPVKEAADPILAIAKKYADEHPGKPIALIGVSNGARIVDYIETELRKTHSNHVHVATLAGAHAGSKSMNLVEGTPLDNHHPELREELKHHSETVTRQIKEMREPLPNGVLRDYTFVVTTEELQVWPPVNGLPVINQGEHRYYVHAEGHTSVVNRAKDLVLKRIKEAFSEQV